MSPTVTVVVPVHNCMPYAKGAFASLYNQSLPRDRVEVIAVDDGSTDGSSELLAWWSERWPQLRVISQECSGSAGGPRNVGIEAASGDYVFFLDGDDCLGPEALERLLELAMRNDSDIVYAKVVGVGGRLSPRGGFHEDVDRAELTSGVYLSLLPFKLFRRRLLLEHDLRFPEDIRIMEDQPFVASCLLAADTVSVLASYDCYYHVKREDGTNLSAEGLPLGTVLRQTQAVVDLVRRESGPGEVRDHLLCRHLRLELLDKFNHVLGWSSEERRDRVEVAAAYAADWFQPSVAPLLTVPERLLAHALASNDVPAVERVARWRRQGARGPLINRAGSWYLGGPGWDEEGGPPASAFLAGEPPDAVAEIESAEVACGRLRLRGRAWLPGLSSDLVEPSAQLVNLKTDDHRSMTVTRTQTPYLNVVRGGPGLDYSGAGVLIELDLTQASLQPGNWGVKLELGSAARTETMRVVPTAAMRSTVFHDWVDDAGVAARGRVGVGTRGYVVVVIEPGVDPGAEPDMESTSSDQREAAPRGPSLGSRLRSSSITGRRRRG